MERTRALAEAADNVRRQKYPKAIEIYRELLTEYPDDPEIRAKCADAYHRAKNRDRAFHHYHRAATIYMNRGETPAALEMFKHANAVSPNEPDILFRMCECLGTLGRFQELEPALVALVGAAKASGDRRRLWALDQLHAMYPEDLNILQQRAEALAEADRVPEAVDSYKKLSANLDPRSPDFSKVLARAAELGADRPDVGVDLASVLLVNGRPRDALSILVPFYEKYPDDVGVLEVLLRSLEAIGAREKVIPARIELLKARAKRDQRAPGVVEAGELIALAPEDPATLEVAAHALTAFGEANKASDVWRRIARVTDKKGLRLERDRAILTLLKARPDDEEALEMGARALEEAGRVPESQALKQRLREIQDLRRRSQIPMRALEVALPRAPSVGRKPPAAAAAPKPVAPPPANKIKKAETMAVRDADVLEVRKDIDVADLDLALPQSQEPERMPISRSPWADDAALTPVPMDLGKRGQTPTPAPDEIMELDSGEFEEVSEEEPELPRPRARSSSGKRASAARKRSTTGRRKIGFDESMAEDPTKVLPKKPPRPPSDTPTASGLDDGTIDDMPIPAPKGRIKDPFFAESRGASTAGELHSSPEEITSRIEELVADEMRRMDGARTGGSAARVPPKKDKKRAAGIDATEPVPPQRPGLVADLMLDGEGRRGSSSKGRGTSKRR